MFSKHTDDKVNVQSDMYSAVWYQNKMLCVKVVKDSEFGAVGTWVVIIAIDWILVSQSSYVKSQSLMEWYLNVGALGVVRSWGQRPQEWDCSLKETP